MMVWDDPHRVISTAPSHFLPHLRKTQDRVLMERLNLCPSVASSSPPAAPVISILPRVGYFVSFGARQLD